VRVSYGAVVERRVRVRIALAVVAVLMVGLFAFFGLRPAGAAPGGALGTVVSRVSVSAAAARDTVAYAGQGAWVDAYDFAPTYQKRGAKPPITPADVDDMAAHGVQTLFMQATRVDSNQAGGFVDRALVADFLVRAHRDGMRVVGWYLPSFADVDGDLSRIMSVADFDVLGHRFDGIAIDIEDVDTVTDVDTRNQRLVDLSTRLRDEVGNETLGAIVLPPVLTEGSTRIDGRTSRGHNSRRSTTCGCR
jgi:hypothetical protein